MNIGVHTPSILLIAAALLAGCAGQRAPEGGPLDTTPPEIVSVFPAPNTVNFSGESVILEFSEYVDRRSVEESIFMSPAMQQVEFDWSGTEVEMRFNEPLRPSTTYVVTVGTDVKDVRNGNRMANAFSLAFSTGGKIDNGVISGTVYDDQPSGVMIFSYRLNGIDADTLNPAVTRPDYITQTGTTGQFMLTNIAPGMYRLFAVRDEYRNLLYEPETDDAGTAEDVTITESDSVHAGIAFSLAKEDTTSPRIVSAAAPDRRHVVVEFSEAVLSLSVSPSTCAVIDTVTQTTLPIRQMMPFAGSTKRFLCITDPQRGDTAYLFVSDSARDVNGRLINPLARAKLFTGSAAADTLPPSLAYISVKDSTTAIQDTQRIVIAFTDAVSPSDTGSFIDVVRVRDSLSIPITTEWLDPASMSVSPQRRYDAGQGYMIRLRWAAVRDAAGNGYRDSVSQFRFTVADPDNYGSIEGRCVVFGNDAPVVVEGRNIAVKEQSPRQTRADSSGAFRLTMLPEGRYVLKAFVDANKDQKQDAGKVFPYQRAERFVIAPDTIRVRPRWPVDGVMIR